jgi:hypothetical protein
MGVQIRLYFSKDMAQTNFILTEGKEGKEAIALSA